MQHATMFINQGVEVNLVRRALENYPALRSLIPDDGGYIANIFNNEHDRNLDHCIELIHGAIHKNRERYRQLEREQKARARGEIICPQCDGQGKPRVAMAYSSYGNRYEEAVCRFCGAALE